MLIQAVCDESQGPNGTFVIGGILSTAERWAALANDWKALAERFGTIGHDGTREVKFTDRQLRKNYPEGFNAFARLVHEVAICSVIFCFNVKDLQAATKRILIEGRHPVRIGHDVQTFATINFLNMFTERVNLSKVGIEFDDDIEFIFDHHRGQSKILRVWADAIDSRPDIVKRIGSTPIFCDSKSFLPIQAADLWIGMIRQSSEEDMQGTQKLKNISPIKTLSMVLNQDDLVNIIKHYIRKDGNGANIIYDISFQCFAEGARAFLLKKQENTVILYTQGR